MKADFDDRMVNPEQPSRVTNENRTRVSDDTKYRNQEEYMMKKEKIRYTGHRTTANQRAWGKNSA